MSAMKSKQSRFSLTSTLAMRIAYFNEWDSYAMAGSMDTLHSHIKNPSIVSHYTEVLEYHHILGEA